MRDAIENGVYTTTTPQPNYPNCTGCGITPGKQAKFCAECGAPQDAKARKAAYRQATAGYRQEKKKLHEAFKRDALAEVGLTDHPYADAIFDKAWEDAHSSGLWAVFNALEDLADLFKMPVVSVATLIRSMKQVATASPEMSGALATLAAALPETTRLQIYRNFQEMSP